MLFKACVLKNFLLATGKVRITKMQFCLFSSTCGTLKKCLSHGGPFQNFWDQLRIKDGEEEEEEGGGYFGKASVVCAYGVVCVCGKCNGVAVDVLNDVFCAVSLSDTMWSATAVLLRKTAFGGNASL